MQNYMQKNMLVFTEVSGSVCYKIYDSDNTIILKLKIP